MIKEFIKNYIKNSIKDMLKGILIGIIVATLFLILFKPAWWVVALVLILYFGIRFIISITFKRAKFAIDTVSKGKEIYDAIPDDAKNKIKVQIDQQKGRVTRLASKQKNKINKLVNIKTND